MVHAWPGKVWMGKNVNVNDEKQEEKVKAEQRQLEGIKKERSRSSFPLVYV